MERTVPQLQTERSILRGTTGIRLRADPFPNNRDRGGNLPTLPHSGRALPRETATQASGARSLIVDSEGDLLLIDLSNGQTLAYLGRCTPAMTDIAFDLSGQLYGIDIKSSLYRIDTQTAGASFVGDLGVKANSLEFREDGVLFAVGQNSLYIVDPATGAASTIATLPSQYQSAGDVTFDDNNALYITMTDGSLVRVGPGIDSWGVVGNTGIKDVFGLITGTDGVLYGFRNGSSTILKVDPLTAMVTPAATLQDPRINGVYGATTDYRPPFSLQPTTAPTVVIQPNDTKAIIGQTVSLMVVAGGSPPLTYQWTFNGKNIADATSPVLSLAGISLGQEGGYQVTVTNPLGPRESGTATLRVLHDRYIICDSNGHLFAVNLQDGTIPVYFGQTPQIMFDIAFGPSGELYGIDGGQASYQGSMLYRIDLATAATSVIGRLGVAANGLGCRADGALFACAANLLYRVNAQTGAATAVLTNINNSQFSGDLAFDPQGNLYAPTTDGSLIQVDSSLARWRSVGNTGYSDVWGLVYSADSFLYGFTGRADLLRIDPSTGKTAFLTQVTGHGALQVYGAAGEFQPFLGDFNTSLLTTLGPGNVPPPAQPLYADLPPRGSGKSSLVFITHGWNLSAPDQSWVDRATVAVSNAVTSDWQIDGYKWDAQGAVFLDSAAQRGVVVGKALAAQNWDHIHLIAHSAGAALIQAASEVIKHNSRATVQTTFLDPFVGFFYHGKQKYGNGADWSDCYFALNRLNSLTDGPLDHSYNVDVTFLDPSRHKTPFEGATVNGQPCYESLSTHSWPVSFYTNTIPPRQLEDAQPFGFPLSKEEGGWGFALSHYSTTNASISILGVPDPACYAVNESTPAVYEGVPLDIFTLPYKTGTADTVQIQHTGINILLPGLDGPRSLQSHGEGQTESTGATTLVVSNAWLAIGVAVTNALDFVEFDAQFLTNTQAKGILSVTWNTNPIGYLDGRGAMPGSQHYIFALTSRTTNGSYVLGFRLDAFSNTTCGLAVTNIVFGSSAFPGPSALAIAVRDPEQGATLTFASEPGHAHLLEGSTDLVNWLPITFFVNTNDSFTFVDRTSTNLNWRFYHVLPR